MHKAWPTVFAVVLAVLGALFLGWHYNHLTVMTALGTLLGAFLFFTPTLIGLALNRESDLAIFIMNSFFGLIAVGWFIALFWALSDRSKKGDGHER